MTDGDVALLATLDALADDHDLGLQGDWDEVTRRAERRPRRRASRSLVLIVGAVLLVTGAAVATAGGVFDSITAANHPSRPADKLSARERKIVGPFHPIGGLRIIGSSVLSESRLLAVLPNRWKLYAVPTSTHGICATLIAPHTREAASSCGPGLTTGRAITFDVVYTHPNLGGPILFGIARDDVRSVTVTVNDRQRGISVHANAYYLVGAAGDRISINHVIVTFTDGHRQDLR
jgi:hypothetical protein